MSLLNPLKTVPSDPVAVQSSSRAPSLVFDAWTPPLGSTRFFFFSLLESFREVKITSASGSNVGSDATKSAGWSGLFSGPLVAALLFRWPVALRLKKDVASARAKVKKSPQKMDFL